MTQVNSGNLIYANFKVLKGGYKDKKPWIPSQNILSNYTWLYWYIIMSLKPCAHTLSYHLKCEVYLEGLLPLPRVLGTLDDLNLGREHHLGSHLQT